MPRGAGAALPRRRAGIAARSGPAGRRECRAQRHGGSGHGHCRRPVAAAAAARPRRFDHVMANPPFSRAGGQPAPDPAKSAATIEGEADLADWVRFALTMVRPKGSVTFVHRADRIDALLGLLAGPGRRGRGVPAVARPGRPASRILVRARKQVAAPARLLAGLVLHEADGRFTAAAEAVLREGSRWCCDPAGAARRLPAVRSYQRRVWHSAAIIPIFGIAMNFPGPPETSADRAVSQSAAGGLGAAVRWRHRAARSRIAVSLASHAAALERAFAVSGLAPSRSSINSPGGSPVQSALLYRRIRQLAEEKGVPVFAFAEDVAASGGYWLALAGDEIYGRGTSLLGSIGVVTAEFRRSPADRTLRHRAAAAHRRRAQIAARPVLAGKPVDVARLTALQQDIHDSFKEHVRRRRAGKIDAADESLFSGEVLTGRMALARGLIDGIGDLRSVMRARYGDKVRLVPIAPSGGGAGGCRGCARRRRREGRSPVAAELLDWLEARALWARFGL